MRYRIRPSQFPHMPKTDLVPCFYWGQDFLKDEPVKVLLRSEVRDLKKQSRGFFIDHGHAFRLCDSESPAYRDRESGEEKETSAGPSEPCISFSEMQANVGIVRDGVKNERGLIHMAQAKVRWYPHIRSYPQLASGRWAQASA